ncbi:MAG: TIGR00266 family protein [Ruminococcus bromii]|nr:TIGR00266 family protein [Ruminococcus bromii]
MTYEIIGGNLPAVLCRLEQGEQIVCESGAMSWMDDVFTMTTNGGGIGKMFGRAFTGESLFRNVYTAQRAGEIAFASSFPGNICAFELTGNNSIIAQRSSFLASTAGVNMSVFFQKTLGSSAFSGEGFILQKFTGRGIVFIEIDGAAKEYKLAPGERKIMDTGHLVMMDGTCKIDIERVKGVKNALFGGEGFFNTVVTGPGRLVIQTMPIAKTAQTIITMLPRK